MACKILQAFAAYCYCIAMYTNSTRHTSRDVAKEESQILFQFLETFLELGQDSTVSRVPSRSVLAGSCS